MKSILCLFILDSRIYEWFNALQRRPAFVLYQYNEFVTYTKVKKQTEKKIGEVSFLTELEMPNLPICKVASSMRPFVRRVFYIKDNLCMCVYILFIGSSML
mgnify:CR=1 FL=1